VGREPHLQQLEKDLFVDGRFSKMALFALGGMGKTSIALELVYRVRDNNPSCSVFWVTSTSAESFEQSYYKIGQKLALSGAEDKKTDIKKLVMDYLSDEKAGQWFMVFDNADDINDWFKKSDFAGSYRLVDYIPRSSRGCALLTTRSERIARSFARHSVSKVPEMDMNTSLHLLCKTLDQEVIQGGNDDAKRLLEKLCFIPLAIVQAGAYITMNYTTISKYLVLLNDTEESLAETLSEDFEDDWRYQDQKNPIVTTWIVSFEQIQRQNLLAADYLSYISCIEPKAIPQAILPPGPSTKQQLEAIACLISYSFLAQQVNNSFDMHQLVHLVTRNWLKKTQNYEKYYREVISRLTEVFPTPDPAYRDLWRTYLPHIKFALSLDRMQIIIDYGLLSRYGRCLLSDGRYFEAELPLAEAAEATVQILGVEHPETITSMGKLALIYRIQGRWKEAEELEVRVMEISKTALGAEHPHTLTSMDSLASTYWIQGRWKEAGELFVQVIEISKTVLGAEHPDTLTSMGNLAVTYWNQSRWKEAEELGVQVMETCKTLLGAEHPNTLTSMANLAFTWRSLGRMEDALSLMKKSFQLRKQQLGLDHPDTQSALDSLNKWETANSHIDNRG
jgi:tetratricopeptide (TPR) repeat protein